ncbi:MAG: bifunctional nuclease family protein [Planctomycetes bacterium]|nr:bifunctional nuclease family protein [Planctomycetota bacterium]
MNLEKVSIKRVIGPTPSGAAVLLGNDKKTFVVFIGFYEAAALIREINQEVPARPLTHELIQNVFLGFDVEIKQVIISSIIENTFCATLILRQCVRDGNGDWVPKRNEVRIDARPSDCFVMALKNKIDLYVAADVFENVPDVTHMADEVEGSLSSGQYNVQLGGGMFPTEQSFGGENPQPESESMNLDEAGEFGDSFLETLPEEFLQDDEEDDDEEWKS